jgi:predicted DCC family thiol-disulfide oxidoreductase YuxK
VEKLYVLYDAKCELCQRLKNWLLTQRAWIEIRLIAASSDEANHLFPTLRQIASVNDLVVIGDGGQVYLNNNAWIMALYALEEYRDWARRMAHPLLAPLARQAFATISRNRYAISRWLGAGGPEEIANELRRVPLEPCAAPHPSISDYLR